MSRSMASPPAAILLASLEVAPSKLREETNTYWIGRENKKAILFLQEIECGQLHPALLLSDASSGDGRVHLVREDAGSGCGSHGGGAWRGDGGVEGRVVGGSAATSWLAAV